MFSSVPDHSKKNVKYLSNEAEDILASYDWPGNIRELRNLVERIVVLESDLEIGPEHLPEWLIGRAGVAYHRHTRTFILPDEGVSLEKLEKDLIQQALERSNHNKTQAAKLLQISYDTMRYQVKKFGLE